MRLLLDTCVLLWFADDPSQIEAVARREIANARNTVCVSSVTVQEIVIKQSLGRLSMRSPILPLIAENRFTPLAITFDHAQAMSDLPAIHKDPFDRQLVAQCKVERLTLVTRDRILEQYGIPMLLA